jgi:hypothetical protein
MPSQRVLVAVTDPVAPSALKRAVRDHVDPEADVRLVSFPSLSFLEWVASDEDDARTEAEEFAAEGGRALHGPGPVELELGDSDPVQAVEDALQTFPADEILLISPTDRGITQPDLDSFGVPVHALTIPAWSRSAPAG